MVPSATSSEVIYGAFRYGRTAEGPYGLNLVRELSRSEWNEIVSAHAVVFQATHSFDKFLEFAWSDFQESEGALLNDIDRDQANSGVAVTDLQYRLLNFSVGLKLYHERILAEVNRACTSEQKEHVNSAFSKLYDINFGYRLVYSMRNAYLHGVRDLVHLSSSKRLVQGPEESTEADLKVELNKEAFTNSRTNAAVRNEVRELTEIPDIRQLCLDAYVGVHELHPQLMEIILPNASKAAQLIWSYMEDEQGERLHFMKLDPKFTNKTIELKLLDRVGFRFVIERCA